MSISMSAASSASSYPPKPPPAAAKAASGKTAEAEFLDFARKTPAERIRDAVLKKMGLTQEDYDKLDPEEKRAVDEQINEEIKKQVELSGDKRTGMIADITV